MFRASRSKIRYPWYFLFPLLLTAGLKESGATQQWDLFALDRLLRIRPLEAIENRITIVTIDEDDLKQEPGRNSISDRKLADVIDLITTAKPSIIGVDLIRDGQIDTKLIDSYQRHKNVIGLSKELPPDVLKAPIGLPVDRVGFGDYEADSDGAVRRATLAIFKTDRSSKQAAKYSFAFQIARHYLQQHDQKISISPERLELGSHSISPLKIADSSDRSKYFDIIVNYRHIYPTFAQVKLTDILAEKLSNLQNRIVLIGYIATTKQDFINTQVIPNPDINGNIYGVEYHGHIISQLIATTLNERNSIQVIPSWGEYLWVLIWIYVARLGLNAIESRTNFWKSLSIIFGYFSVIIISIYLLLLVGWWLSIGLTFSTISMIYLPILISFYQRERSLLAIAEKRRQAITDSFNAIHNGPLQELSLLLQAVKSDNISPTEINIRLEKLDRQIRSIGESLQTDSISGIEVQKMLVLGDGSQLDLNTPLNELFYLVSDRTADPERYPNFGKLKIKIINSFIFKN